MLNFTLYYHLVWDCQKSSLPQYHIYCIQETKAIYPYLHDFMAVAYQIHG